MDPTNPLSDPHPPRHAYESDDEDEFDDASHGQKPASPPSASIDIEIQGAVDKQLPLVIASGDAGQAWARGAGFKEKKGAILVDKTQIGILFSYSSVRGASINVLVSEAAAALPVHAMYPYASLVLEKIDPSRVIILDKYSAASYIANSKLDYDSAPVRYLSTARSLNEMLSASSSSQSNILQPFRPPNLIQTTTAAFLSILEAQSQATPCPAASILLPSLFISRATTSSKVHSADSEDADRWHAPLMKEVHDVLILLASGGTLSTADKSWAWDLSPDGQAISSNQGRKRVDYNEGMYI